VKALALVAHHHSADAPRIAAQVVAWAAAREVEVLALEADAAALGVTPSGDLARADVALSIGGDGTMLRTVELVAPHQIPVLGINIGNLGYLTTVEPPGIVAALDRIAANDHGIEERMMLSTRVVRADGAAVAERMALNEVVVERQMSGHTVRLLVSVDDEPFTVYATDAMIVATATGSTAYSLSAGGPILSPRHRALVVTPVAPHMLFNRSLVLDPHQTVTVKLQGFRDADVTVDGRVLASLRPGDRTEVSAATTPARFITLDATASFHQVVKSKFGLQDR
jgi:NAD+ kinase